MSVVRSLATTRHEEVGKRDSSLVFTGSRALSTPDFRLVAYRTERTHFCGFKTSPSWSFVMAVLELNTFFPCSK